MHHARAEEHDDPDEEDVECAEEHQQRNHQRGFVFGGFEQVGADDSRDDERAEVQHRVFQHQLNRADSLGMGSVENRGGEQNRGFENLSARGVKNQKPQRDHTRTEQSSDRAVDDNPGPGMRHREVTPIKLLAHYNPRAQILR